jgi:hypothetical protein
MTYQFKFLKDCAALELVRVKLNDEAPFAIVGAMEPNSRRGFVVLESAKPPRYINFMHEGMIDGDFENYQMLSYGNAYEIIPDEGGECRIGIGPLFKKVGVLVLAKQDRLLAVTDHPSQVRYFNFQTGLMQGEPGQTARAAFAKWTICLEGIELPLLAFGQST